MIKNYKIGSKEFNIDFKNELNNVMSNNPKDSLIYGLVDLKIRNKLKTHVHTRIYNFLDVDFVVKYFYEYEINNIVNDIIDNIHVMLILKNKE